MLDRAAHVISGYLAMPIYADDYFSARLGNRPIETGRHNLSWIVYKPQVWGLNLE
jgi:hypothetical protein